MLIKQNTGCLHQLHNDGATLIEEITWMWAENIAASANSVSSITQKAQI